MLSQRLCAHTQAMMRRRIRACVRGAPMRACFSRASIVGPGAMLEDAAAHSVRKIGKLSDVCCTAVSAPPEHVRMLIRSAGCDVRGRVEYVESVE